MFKQHKLGVILVILILVLALCNVALANTGTGSINHVVLEIEGDMIVFTIGAYGSALAAGAGDQLYDYMASGDVPVVRAVGSGDKYIGIGAYGTAFAQEGNTADAIATATALDEATVRTYLVFEGFDTDGNPILQPLFPVDTTYFTFDSSTGTITDYDPAGGLDVVIPSEIDGVAVEHIGDEAFLDKGLTSVFIPDSVITIGAGAFDLNALTTVTIGGNVTTIGDWAFAENALTDVMIPDSVVTIGEGAFWENGLATVTLGSSVTLIGDFAFALNQLTGVVIPDSVVTIGEDAFWVNELQSVTLGSGLTTIGNGAFEDNDLQSITFPDSVTSIGVHALVGNNLTSITIGPDVEIGDNMLSYLHDEFRDAYEAAGRAAGTYVGTQDGPWSKL